MKNLNEKKDFFLLSLGSNLGDRIENINKAIEMLTYIDGVEIEYVSSFYETEPVGYKKQPWFINIAISGFSTLTVYEFFNYCKMIEQEIGRKPRPKFHEREIDIDIIFYGNTCIDSALIQIPHKRMAERRFVLVPLAEIHSDFVHPTIGKTIRQLLIDCPDVSKVIKIEANN